MNIAQILRGKLVNMKFWKKLVLFVITIISIILSCSRYYIVKNNFSNAIGEMSKQNANKHILEKRMVENDIVQTIQNGEEITDEKIAEYIKSLYTFLEDNSELVALYTENFELIYSNIKTIENIDVRNMLNTNIDTYCFRKLDNKHYMLISSNWSINNKIIYIINAYDVSSIYAEKDRQLRDILFTDIIILIISVSVISVFSIFLTKPIDILNRITKEIANGNFDKKIDIRSNDEVGELAKSFNMMAEQIENKINELNLQVKQKNDFINRFYS